MTPEAQQPLRIFCSYSHRDEEYLNELRDWLRGLERQGLIEWWHDREIVPGWEWEEVIEGVVPETPASGRRSPNSYRRRGTRGSARRRSGGRAGRSLRRCSGFHPR